MSAAHLPQQNHLLRSLPPGVRNRIFPHLQLVDMPVGHVLYGSGGPVNEVHFPTDSVIAPLQVAKNDVTVQIAVIGNEGMAGCAVFVAGEAALKQAVVQCAGHAFRLSSDVLREEYGRNAEFYCMLLRYTQALIAQVTQTVACNLKHPLEQRLCRWLLLTLDRVTSNRLPIKQEVIEKVMGEPSERVSETLHAFDALGVIQQSDGQLIVPDRHKLERASCDCYSSVRSVIGPTQPQPALKLIDTFPELTNALVDGLSSFEQIDFIKQLEDALVSGVKYDRDADAASISLVPVHSARTVKRNVVATAHRRKIPIECRYWVNLDIDGFGRVTAIEIMRPPAALKEELVGAQF
jgi:CRP-like cAMP-binding protein